MNNDTQFLASGHSLKKISSKISSLQATKKIKQHCYLSISGPRPFFKKDFHIRFLAFRLQKNQLEYWELPLARNLWRKS
ncbi:hypothetical protein CIK90_00680 [Prevotella sp. P5-126]|nr:hypothetical protein CIK90_00680 [Prevotella sp. P5-126]